MFPFKYPRTSQPQQPVDINWSNPLTKGLVEAALPYARATAKGRLASLTGSGVFLGESVGPPGKALRCAAFDNGAHSGILFPGNWAPSAPLTVSTLFYVGSSSAVEFGLGASYLSNNFGWRFSCISQIIRGSVTWGGGGSAGVTAAHGVTIPLNTPTLATMVIRPTTFDLYINGVLSVSGTSHSYSGSSNAGVMPFFLTGSGYGFGDISGVYSLNVWSRELSGEEIKSLRNNPWQIFLNDPRPGLPLAAVISISRPSSDVTTTGWTGTPDNVTLFTNINETTPSDTSYITSPTITGGGDPTVHDFLPVKAAGTWSVNTRAEFGGASADVRVILLDGSNVVQGTSEWQTVTSSWATYPILVTTTGTSSRVKIEVR